MSFFIYFSGFYHHNNRFIFLFSEVITAISGAKLVLKVLKYFMRKIIFALGVLGLALRFIKSSAETVKWIIKKR